MFEIYDPTSLIFQSSLIVLESARRMYRLIGRPPSEKWLDSYFNFAVNAAKEATWHTVKEIMEIICKANIYRQSAGHTGYQISDTLPIKLTQHPATKAKISLVQRAAMRANSHLIPLT